MISPISPALLYLAATTESVALTTYLRMRYAGESPELFGGGGHETSELYALTSKCFAPAHDGRSSAGASTRILSSCFAADGSSGRIASAPADEQKRAGMAGASPNAVLESRNFAARAQV